MENDMLGYLYSSEAIPTIQYIGHLTTYQIQFAKFTLMMLSLTFIILKFASA